MQSVVLHEIVAIPGRGNALVAAQLIRKGEVIFTEKPTIWHSRSKSEGFCSTCGKSITKQRPNYDAEFVVSDIIRCSQSQSSSTCINVRSRSIGGSSSCDGSSSSSYNKYCCQSSYCSIFCRDKADYDGHRWLCGEASAERYKVQGEIRTIQNCSIFLFLMILQFFRRILRL